MKGSAVKILSLLMVLLLVVGIVAGCGGGTKKSSDNDNQELKEEEKKDKTGEDNEDEEEDEEVMGKVYEIEPGKDYTMYVPILKPGDELVLHEGEYKGKLTIQVSGEPGKPIKIRGYGKGEARPILTYEWDNANLWQVYGDHIDISYLEFRPVKTNAIRIGDANERGARKDITIRDCIFRDCGGGSIDANKQDISYDGIKILNNQIIGVKATPIYIGQHDGLSEVTNFLFEGNFIDGSQIVSDDIVGYGIELKLNVKGGIIRNNLIINTKGPGIMVYGAEDGEPQDANIVEGNIVAGSRQDAGILVGAGPSIARNNISLGCSYGGIMVYDYNNRGLLYDVTVSGNTAAGNVPYDMNFADINETTKNIKVTDNIVLSKAGTEGYRHLSSLASFVESDNNQTGSCTEQLSQLIEDLKVSCPDMDALNKVWPKLDEGPLNLEKLVKLLEGLLQ